MHKTIIDGADGVVPSAVYCSVFVKNTGTINVFIGTVNLIIAWYNTIKTTSARYNEMGT